MRAVEGDAPVSPTELLKQQKRALINGYANANDRDGSLAILETVIPLVLLGWIAARSLDISLWITAATILAISVLLLRVFSLMHDCGHGSLFRSQWLNRAVGFGFGVLCGMPQYVWSQNHHYHHQTNGNWDKYRGPLSTLSVDEYEALSRFQQRVYSYARHLAVAPLAGFVYLIFNPRVNWLMGNAALLAHLIRGKRAATFQTRFWKSAKEYRHQSANNVVLLTLWALASWAIGPVAFFAIYLASVSLAGGVGIAVFTVQHNFEHAYASDEAGWDIDEGALSGTSFLILPRWLNWATANIGFHHIHHLSASIPAYSLVKCHAEYAHLFTGVRRITLWEIPRNLKCILWDNRARRIISVQAYQEAKRRAPFADESPEPLIRAI